MVHEQQLDARETSLGPVSATQNQFGIDSSNFEPIGWKNWSLKSIESILRLILVISETGPCIYIENILVDSDANQITLTLILT